MFNEYNNIRIRGICSCAPGYVEDNMKYAEILGQHRVEKQIRITGIRRRHLCGDNQKVSDLLYVAGERLLSSLKWDRNEIRVILLVTQSPDYIWPSTAFVMQKMLGIGEDCIVFDMNLGCSGYIVGMQVLSSLLQNMGEGAKGLLMIGDLLARVTPAEGENPTSQMLFGSAAAVTAVELSEGHPVKFMQKSDGRGFDIMLKKFGQPSFMDGAHVFGFTMNEVTDSIKQYMKHYDIKEEEIDFYVFHQAQKLIVDNIAKVCKLPKEKLLCSMEEYGNTSGASVPFTLCANKERLPDKKKVKVMLCGYGVGLSWGIAVLEVETDTIFPVEITDQYFDNEEKKGDENNE